MARLGATGGRGGARGAALPAGRHQDEINQQNADDMLESQDTATVAALRQAGIPLTTTVVVSGSRRTAPSAGMLEVDDVIVTVDGKAVKTPEELRDRGLGAQAGRPSSTSASRARTWTATCR